MEKLYCAILLLAVSIIFHSCNSTKQDTNLETNRAVVKKYHEIRGNGQVAELDKILAPDYIYHQIGGKDDKGINLTKDQIKRVRTSLPDLKDEIIDIVIEGDKVVTRYKLAGTFRVKFMNYAPTGKPVVMEEVSVYRIANGKIAEEWNIFDSADLFNQLKAKN